MIDTSFLDEMKENIGHVPYTVRNSMGKSFDLLEEEALSKEMTERIEPYLERIVVTGRLENEKNEKEGTALRNTDNGTGRGDSGAGGSKGACAARYRGLYYELYPRENPLGTVVISYGFTESVRKYHEFIWYLYSYGFQVAILDHRGHGKSLREVDDTSLVHVEAFRQYVEDMHRFVQEIVIPGLAGAADSRNRLYLYGHSMGGCIAARYLELYPGDFSRAVLNAPMLGVKLGPWPSFAAALLCDLNILLGRGRHMLFYQHGFQPDEPFAKSSADSEARFQYYHDLRLKDTCYQTYSASYRWAREAIRAGKRARRRKEASRVSARVLLFQAENDSLVTPGAQRQFLERIADGRMVVVPGTRHEIYRAGNRVLKPYLEKVCSFLAEDSQPSSGAGIKR